MPKLSESLKYSSEVRIREKLGAGFPTILAPLNPVIGVFLYIPKDIKITAQMKNKNVNNTTKYILKLAIGFIARKVFDIFLRTKDTAIILKKIYFLFWQLGKILQYFICMLA